MLLEWQNKLSAAAVCFELSHSHCSQYPGVTLAKPQLLNSKGNWSLPGFSSSPGTAGQRAPVAVGDNKAVEEEQPPHSTASTWELLPNPLTGVWLSFPCGFWHSGPGWLSQAGSTWLPVPDREQRMSSERVAMRTLRVWAVS